MMKYWVKFIYVKFDSFECKHKEKIESLFVTTDDLEKWWEEHLFSFEMREKMDAILTDVVILNELKQIEGK